MKNLLTLFLIIQISLALGQIPYHLNPDWESNANGYVSTGLGIADINGDGYKDLIIANGNDIERQHLTVYYNNGDGTFPLDPSWESDDIDYHGHVACGDIDKDGDIDVAVSVYIGASGFTSPGKVKVYYNLGTALEPVPSFVSDPFYTFSCALGDADGDGDLDLAVATGEPYGGTLDHGKIFLNNHGQFQVTPEWETNNLMGALDVEFGDINQEGFMDVIFVCENGPASIYLANNSAQISPEPAWQAAEISNYINSVDIGYKDGKTQVVMTGNDQLGGDGKVRMYEFQEIIPTTSAATWTSLHFGEGSGIILSDVTLDDTLDLIYGGWWLPVKIAKGTHTGFQTNPSYTSNTGSVVEAIQLADLGKQAFESRSFTIVPDETNTGTHVILLPDQLVEEIVSIQRNGIPVPLDHYTSVPNKCWISFTDPLVFGEIIVINYNYSPDPDMVITNWDSSIGNYIFYNTNLPSGIDKPGNPYIGVIRGLYPNPAHDFIILDYFLVKPGDIDISIYNSEAELIKLLNKGFSGIGQHQETIDLNGLPGGIYIAVIRMNDEIITGKFTVSR
jgi:hypothetical protein